MSMVPCRMFLSTCCKVCHGDTLGARGAFDHVATKQYYVSTEVSNVPQSQVGVRELKNQLSYYLRKVSQGNTLIVTDRGKPLAELRPVSRQPEDRVAALVASGQVRWSGKRLGTARLPTPVHHGKSVAELILRDRE